MPILQPDCLSPALWPLGLRVIICEQSAAELPLGTEQPLSRDTLKQCRPAIFFLRPAYCGLSARLSHCVCES